MRSDDISLLPNSPLSYLFTYNIIDLEFYQLIIDNKLEQEDNLILIKLVFLIINLNSKYSSENSSFNIIYQVN